MFPPEWEIFAAPPESNWTFFCFSDKTMLSQYACKSAILLIEVGCTRFYLEAGNKSIFYIYIKKGKGRKAGRFLPAFLQFYTYLC